jgi:hypothetical protein
VKIGEAKHQISTWQIKNSYKNKNIKIMTHQTREREQKWG